MAKLANKSQPIVSGVMNPQATYSRVVIVQLLVAAGVGNEDYGITPPLGNRVRLLGVDVWIQPTNQGGFIVAYLKVKSGTGVPISAIRMSVDWLPVMDVSMILGVGMMLFCCEKHMHFSMNKLYVGESQRFGLYSQSNSNTQYTILGAFEIAEA